MGWAVDFLLCCVGVSVVIVAGAWAMRLARAGKPAKAHPQPPQEEPEDMSLGRRLAAFQDTRFASPIVQRRFQSPAQLTGQEMARPLPPVGRPKVPEQVSPFELKRKKPPEGGQK